MLGGGPAGCGAAIGLARAGARVVICERGRAPKFKPGEIVEPTIRMPLSELDLLDSFEMLGSLTLAGSLSLWDSDVPVEFCGMVNAHGHGALIDRQKFEAWLLASALALGVDVVYPATALSVEQVGNKWKVSWGGKDQRLAVCAPLLIEATGRGPGEVGYSRRSVKDRLVALMWYSPIDEATRDQRLLIESAQHGWWYAAILPGHRAVLSFMTDADLLPRTHAARHAYLDDQLAATKIMREHRKGMLAPLQFRSYPANSSLRDVIGGSNWVAVGDAAATYDPLSGHGVSVALAKGASIARLLTINGDLHRVVGTYADAERAAFFTYLRDRDRTYARAARSKRSTFWTRRSGVSTSEGGNFNSALLGNLPLAPISGDGWAVSLG